MSPVVAQAAAAREEAREILGERRFQGTEVPRPFEAPLDWAGARLRDLGDTLDGLVDALDDVLPGGVEVALLVLAVLGFAAAVWGFRRLIRGRAAAAGSGAPIAAGRPVDPLELERAADAAERDGDFERAVRLRFRAGVARLEAREVLQPGAPRTTGEVAAALGSPAFDALGADFDAIAYGGRPAAAPDAEAARRGWRDVLEAASR